MKGLGGEVGDMIDWDGVEVDGPGESCISHERTC
jgi:hypothetical protein